MPTTYKKVQELLGKTPKVGERLQEEGAGGYQEITGVRTTPEGFTIVQTSPFIVSKTGERQGRGGEFAYYGDKGFVGQSRLQDTPIDFSSSRIGTMGAIADLKYNVPSLPGYVAPPEGRPVITGPRLGEPGAIPIGGGEEKRPVIDPRFGTEPIPYDEYQRKLAGLNKPNMQTLGTAGVSGEPQVSPQLATGVQNISQQIQNLIQRVQTEGVTDASGNFIIQPGTQQPTPREGDFRTNPQTGQKEFYNPFGEWTPVTDPTQITGGTDVTPTTPTDTPPQAPPQAPVDTTVPSGADTTPTLPPDTATDTTAGFLAGIQASLDASRKALEDTYKKQLEDLKTQQADAQKRIDELTKQQETLIEGDIKTALTPFREELENAERQRLYINENFQANQRLTNELDTLLTQGNALIEQQRAVTGLNVIRQPRIAQTISDISARVGILNSVMAARNGQIAQAYNMIDRSVEAVTADRQDQLTYYNTLLDFYEGKKGEEKTKLVSITKDQKDFLNAQIGLLENDMALAQKNAENLKAAMTDPNLALAYADAGVTLNDSPDQIAQKLASYAYTQEVRTATNEQGEKGYSYLAPGQTAPAGSETITTTDSKGVQRTWWKKKEVKAEATPASFDEWTLAGGLAGTGKTYAQYLADKQSTTTDTKQADVASMAKAMQGVAGGDGFISPDDYAVAKKNWVMGGYSAKDFDDIFSNFRNPDNSDYAITP